jgi:hypothetical protein
MDAKRSIHAQTLSRTDILTMVGAPSTGRTVPQNTSERQGPGHRNVS